MERIHLKLHGHRVDISTFQTQSVDDPPSNPVDLIYIVLASSPYLYPVDFGSGGHNDPADLVVWIEDLTNESHGQVRP